MSKQYTPQDVRDAMALPQSVDTDPVKGYSSPTEGKAKAKQSVPRGTDPHLPGQRSLRHTLPLHQRHALMVLKDRLS